MLLLAAMNLLVTCNLSMPCAVLLQEGPAASQEDSLAAPDLICDISEASDVGPWLPARIYAHDCLACTDLRKYKHSTLSELLATHAEGKVITIFNPRECSAFSLLAG